MRAIISLLLVLTSYNLLAQTVSTDAVVVDLNSEQIAELDCIDLSCQPISIERDNIESNVFVLFPRGGTETGVWIVEYEAYLKYETDRRELDYHKLRRDGKMALDGQPLTINMTHLKDGKYVAEYLSCNKRGTFLFSLTTKEK